MSSIAVSNRCRGSGRSREAGFTLIELLTILAILGVLASLIVAAVFDAVPASARAACQGDFKTVEGAAEVYKAQIGSYPVQLTDLSGRAVGLNGRLDGPWLRDSPNVYTPGASPTITNHAAYGLAIDPATDSIAVGTIRNNGASNDSGSPLVDGVSNCHNL